MVGKRKNSKSRIYLRVCSVICSEGAPCCDNRGILKSSNIETVAHSHRFKAKFPSHLDRLYQPKILQFLIYQHGRKILGEQFLSFGEVIRISLEI